jgi:F-type H+-transporting ATPase subunit epsilon
MADTFDLEIATPERSLVKAKAVSAQIPGRDGYFGILPDHAAMVSQLGIGTLKYVDPQGATYVAAVHDGFVEVSDNQVRVVADLAEPGLEIDVDRAQRALERASMEIENSSVGADPAQALAAMMRAEARIEAATEARAVQK